MALMPGRRRTPKIQQQIAADAERVLHVPTAEKPKGGFGPTPLQAAAKTKRNYLIAGAAVGGGAVAFHNMRRNAVYKLYDPFSDREVVVGKADNTTSGTAVRWLPARRPGGQFVSHANKLKVIHITPKRGIDSKLLHVRKGLDFGHRSHVGKRFDEVAKAGNAARYGASLERMAGRAKEGSRLHTGLKLAQADGVTSGAVRARETGRGMVESSRHGHYAAQRYARSQTGRYGRANPFGTPRGIAAGQMQTGRLRQAPQFRTPLP